MTTDPTTVRYTATSGVHLAYQVFGDGPVDLVFVPGFISHLEYAWQDPLLARFLRRLSTLARVITFDKRGMGLSDRDPLDRPIPLSDRVLDLTAVLDAAGSQRAVLLAWSEGGPLAIRFAAEYPERTSGLVLLGTTARFTQAEDFPIGIPREVLSVFIDAMGAEWGTGVGFELYAPSLAEDQRTRAWWAAYQRFAATPGAVRVTLSTQLDVDVRPLMKQVSAPTLVVHRSQDMIIPVECAHYLAEHIAGAVLHEQPAEDHIFWVGHQDDTLAAVRTLIGRTLPDGVPARARRPARPSSGWESLTAAELDIVRLVAQGMTNAQIAARLTISPRTVQTHVTHVLAKLDLRRRSEVAAELARSRPPSPLPDRCDQFPAPKLVAAIRESARGRYKGSMSDLLELPVTTLSGESTTFGALAAGRVALVVNVASRCGLTPQYEALEQLHETYGPRGFTVLGFPCNQFMGQEPGTNEQIAEFCSATYGVTFPMTDKIEVNGAGRDPIYAALRRRRRSRGHPVELREVPGGRRRHGARPVRPARHAGRSGGRRGDRARAELSRQACGTFPRADHARPSRVNGPSGSEARQASRTRA